MSKNTNLSFLTDYITADITNGRIGINNASPAVALDVVGATKITGVLTLTSTISNGTYAYTLPSATGTLALTNAISGTTNYIPKFTSSTAIGNSLIYDDGTNVGIGTASPNTLLTIAGTSQALGTAFNTYGNLLIYSTDSQAINKGGSISFGGKYTTSGTPIATFARIHGKKENTTVDGTAGYLSFETTADATAYLSEKMRITSVGNVGIGTSSPQSRLQAVLINGVTFTPTSTGSIGGSVAQRVHVQAIEPGFMLSTDSNAGNTGQTGSQTYSFGLQLATYGAGDWRSQIYFGSTPLSFVYSGDQGANASERMRISTNGSIGAPNGTNIYNASDIRLKKNISKTTYGLDTISALNPVKFNWVDGFEPSEDGKDMLGFIAQEVQTVIPEAIESFGGNSITIGDTVIDNPLRVNEKFIIPVLVKAIQELKAEIETLKNK